MRERLLLTSRAAVNANGGPAASPSGALAGYAGTGALRAWLRSMTLRMLINIATREEREVPSEEAFFDALCADEPGPDVALVREACRQQFKAAVLNSMGHLSNRERSLLRYAFADGLSVDEIGAIYRVHRATAARWIQDARSRLVEATLAELASRLHLPEAEIASVVRGALSGIDMSILRYFGPNAS